MVDETGTNAGAEALIPGTNVVLLCGDIDDDQVTRVVRGLLTARTKHKEIVLLITSGGGSLFSGMAIASVIRDLSQDCQIIGRVHGIGASAAIYPLIECSRREMASDAFLMIHGMRDTLMGDARSMEAEQEVNAKLIGRQADRLTERSRVPREQWIPILKDQTPHYYDYEQALEAGLIDGPNT